MSVLIIIIMVRVVMTGFVVSIFVSVRVCIMHSWYVSFAIRLRGSVLSLNRSP